MIWGTCYLFYAEVVRACVNVLFSIMVLGDDMSFLLSRKLLETKIPHKRKIKRGTVSFFKKRK